MSRIVLRAYNGIHPGGYVFIAWRSDHPPRHVHVRQKGRLVVKWDNKKPMKGKVSAKVLRLIADLEAVNANNRRKVFEVATGKRRLTFPFAELEVQPTADDPVAKVLVDQELEAEGFSYLLQSGREGTVHIEEVLEHRLLDQTNYRKSVDQLLRLLNVLGCDVQLVVRAKSV
jgi:hypothetical protein